MISSIVYRQDKQNLKTMGVTIIRKVRRVSLVISIVLVQFFLYNLLQDKTKDKWDKRNDILEEIAKTKVKS